MRPPAAADDDDSLPLTASPPLVAAIPDDEAVKALEINEKAKVALKQKITRENYEKLPPPKAFSLVNLTRR